MSLASRIFVPLFFLALIGCQSNPSTGSQGSTASSAGSTPSSASSAAAPTGGTQTQAITDPTFPDNMTAATVTIPAGWNFSGTLVQSSGCIAVPFPVYRAVSPDGLSFTEHMPAVAWVYGSGPMVAKSVNGCLPFKSALSAQDFLKYLAGVLDVQYLSDDPVPADVAASAQEKLRQTQAQYAPQYTAAHLQQPTTTRTLARALVHYQNGTFAMKGRLQAMVDCTATNFPGQKSYLRGIPDQAGSTVNRCSVDIHYFAMPENQYNTVLARVDIPNGGITPNQAWTNAWIARNQQQTAAAIGNMQRQTIINNANTRAHYQQAIAAQTQIHNQFMAQMQQSTDASMARAAASANTNHTIASDWSDYVLDQQTVRDPQTGMTTKVASGYNVTWVNSLGGSNYQTFQTNDVNSNPNGILSGTWTQQVRVHGDGS